jgi:N-acetylglucosaminyldiphosphoundecaprenol N-acetyl-beta-D-mannosaminyltransferase
MQHLRALPVWEGQAAVLSAENNHLDDLSRRVFGVLGLPLDVLGLEDLLQRIDYVVGARTPFLLSTPNVNFLMMSRSDPEFRESLLMSDLCPVDGMPLVWIARLLGIPLRERLSGSDTFEALKSRVIAPKLTVFFFGGSDGAASTVSKKLNQEAGGMKCVGALNPGFGSVDDMSSDSVVQSINSSNADLLTVFLSAKKGQGWLLKNHDRLKIPFRAQFGATINWQAGIVKRAPVFIRKLGFEWLWRIKEEPYLWRRYWGDGLRLLSLFLTCVLPLAIGNLVACSSSDAEFTISRNEDQHWVLVKLSGPAIARNIGAAIACFCAALEARKPIVIDLSSINAIDPRFFGLLLMLRKRAVGQGSGLKLVNATPQIRKTFRLNGFEFLLSAGPTLGSFQELDNDDQVCVPI